jgi:hypothetical protein
MNTLTLTNEQVQQIIWAIDLAENTLEGLSDKELADMGIEIDRKVLFALASTLEALNAK